jgi:putative N6-adenine-specific DNA methylase
MELIATCSFGLEKLVYQEIKKLGLWVVKTEDGRVTFKGEEDDLARANLWFRCVERVHIKLAEFQARTFDELFDNINSLDWATILPAGASFPVLCTTSKSTLHHEPSIQSIAKKAIVKKLQAHYKLDQIPEKGPEYSILIRFNSDICTVSIDTSGESLHKRGYRPEANQAPIKETLAAALVMLSDWTPERPLIDPFCGSGTILMEAAMIALNIAPGLKRHFAFENWQGWSKDRLDNLRREAEQQQKELTLNINGYDIDPESVRIAQSNSTLAGLEKVLHFTVMDFRNLNFQKMKNCTIITNPPYGERLSDEGEVEKTCRDLGQLFAKTTGCSLFLITAFEKFEEVFGRKAAKNRKLFNGKIKCYLYQYPAA